MRSLTLPLIAFGSLLVSGDALSIEEPAFTVVATTDDYEIRRYEPYLVAETTVPGPYRKSGNRAFRILADYIFGNNTAATRMDMTAPVTARPRSEGVEMNMTVPVTARPVGNASDFTWQFVMESAYDRDSLPRPVDDRVTIREIPARYVAAREYSGTMRESRHQSNLDDLLKALKRDGVKVAGAAEAAYYNGPFTLPFLRRNEVLVPVAGASLQPASTTGR